MPHKRFGLLLSAVAVVALAGACDSATGPDDTAGPPASQAPSATAEAASTAPTMDEATRKACTELLAVIDDTAKRVTAAEKIGPPAGHIAVGAEYIAGSMDIYAKSIGAVPAVTEAAAEVADEMDALDKAYQKNPDKKPGKADLADAVTALETACGQG